MSTKSTILCTNCCHIYQDVKYDNGIESDILCIDVSYMAEINADYIEVEWNSDFAAMIRFMVSTIGADELDAFCRCYYDEHIRGK